MEHNSHKPNVMTKHWILAATYKSSKVVHVCDSVYSSLDQSTAKSIQRIFRCSLCHIKIEPVQKQCGSDDCGVYAIAYATAAAFGQDPTKVTFN